MTVVRCYRCGSIKECIELRTPIAKLPFFVCRECIEKMEKWIEVVDLHVVSLSSDKE